MYWVDFTYCYTRALSRNMQCAILLSVLLISALTYLPICRGQVSILDICVPKHWSSEINRSWSRLPKVRLSRQLIKVCKKFQQKLGYWVFFIATELDWRLKSRHFMCISRCVLMNSQPTIPRPKFVRRVFAPSRRLINCNSTVRLN